MEHVNGWCFRGICKSGLWEDDLHVSALRQRLFTRLPTKQDHYSPGYRANKDHNLPGCRVNKGMFARLAVGPKICYSPGRSNQDTSHCCRQNAYSFYFDTLRQYGIVYFIFVRVRVGMKLLKELVAQPHWQRQKNMFKLN